jgi:hypothetical protein
LFFNPGGAFTASATSPVFSLNIVAGPNFTSAGGGLSTSNASETFNITMTITNNGDLPATVTGVTLTSVPAAAFTVNSFTVTPNPIAASGGTATLTMNVTAPGSAGIYALTAALTYTPSVAAVGACGAAGQSQSGITVGTTVVLPPGGGPGPGPGGAGLSALDISVKALPPSILSNLISAGGINSTMILTDIRRSGGYPVGDIAANLTIYQYNATTGQRETLRYRSTSFDCGDARRNAKHCYPSVPEGGSCAFIMTPGSSPGVSTSTNFSVTQPFVYMPSQTSVCQTDQWGAPNSPFRDAIYEAEVNVYDPYCALLGGCPANQTRSTFFGVYSLSCEDRA